MLTLLLPYPGKLLVMFAPHVGIDGEGRLGPRIGLGPSPKPSPNPNPNPNPDPKPKSIPNLTLTQTPNPNPSQDQDRGITAGRPVCSLEGVRRRYRRF